MALQNNKTKKRRRCRDQIRKKCIEKNLLLIDVEAKFENNGLQSAIYTFWRKFVKKKMQKILILKSFILKPFFLSTPCIMDPSDVGQMFSSQNMTRNSI